MLCNLTVSISLLESDKQAMELLMFDNQKKRKYVA